MRKKNNSRVILLFLSFIFLSLQSEAIVTELAVSYAQKKTYFNADNFNNMESTTGSVSFYFMEKLAIELSYTTASILREETIYNGTGFQQQTTLQKVKVYGSDFIFILADKKSIIQPYLKVGISQIEKTMSTKNSDVFIYDTDPINSVSPSYGAGIKIPLTDTFGLKLSYDAWRTETKDSANNKSTIEDNSIRAGLTWVL
ncbi:MAG: outer membrane beta-barrel protein [Deltaproteobacteria bacterium]|jgi:outer membrane protein W|nr:outer membrane beta-barrel protein [Deltaproteobacteria bacterium]